MQFRWLGVFLFLGSSIFAENLVLDSAIIEKDGVVDNVRELNDLFREHQAQYTPIAPPTQSLFIQDYNLIISARFDQLPEKFTRQIIGTLNEDLIPLYKITVYEDPKTQQSVFLNDEGVELYRLDTPPTYSPLTWQREYFQLDESKTLDPWTSWIFSSAHISASMTLVPVEFYETYILAEEQRQLDAAKELVPMMRIVEPTEDSMIVSFQAVSVEDDGAAEEEVPMMAMAAFPPSPGGTTTNTSGSSSGLSNQLMQLTFTPPAGFGNYAEIFRTTSLIPTNWSVVQNAQAVTSGVEATWIDYASSNQATGFYIISDAMDDIDFDGFSNLRESYITHTSYTNFNFYDSDNDGLHDWFETIYFGSITNQAGTNDFDADGLPNNQEWVLNSNSVTWISDPTVFDTDGDGTGDGMEVLQGSDPSNPADSGQAPSNTTTSVTLFVQDRSPDYLDGGYTMTLVSGTNSYSVASTGLDAASNTVNVVAGQTYMLTLIANDFDPYSGAYTATVSGENLAIVDPGGILGVHNDNNTTNNLSSPGKTATVHVMKPEFIFVGYGVDVDHDQAEVTTYLTSKGASVDTEQNIWTCTNSAMTRVFKIKFVNNQRDFLSALQVPNAYVAFYGHSNYGAGLAFNNYCNSLNGLVNIGTPTTAIHWEILSSHLPRLLFPLISIAQNPINEPTDSGYQRFSNDPGTYQGHVLTEIGTVAPSNVFTTVYESGTNSFHFYNKGEPYLIVNNGISDMPATLGYKWLMLATCYSGIYYLDNFSHGTMFYLETAGYMNKPYTKLFVQAVVEEKEEDELKSELNLLNPGGGGVSPITFNYQ